MVVKVKTFIQKYAKEQLAVPPDQSRKTIIGDGESIATMFFWDSLGSFDRCVVFGRSGL